jgi:hypothetical protein
MQKEPKEVLRLITKVLTDPSIAIGQRDQLLKAKLELAKLATSGKLERRQVFRAVEMIAKVMLEIVEEDATRRPE